MHSEQSLIPGTFQGLKQQAADQVLAYIQSGTIVGLGAGSTAILAVRGLAEKLSRGELTDIQGIPCSRVIEAEARRLGIPLTTLEDHPVIDLTFDGADEVDPALNLIKGGGGALLRAAPDPGHRDDRRDRRGHAALRRPRRGRRERHPHQPGIVRAVDLRGDSGGRRRQGTERRGAGLPGRPRPAGDRRGQRRDGQRHRGGRGRTREERHWSRVPDLRRAGDGAREREGGRAGRVGTDRVDGDRRLRPAAGARSPPRRALRIPEGSEP